jgi:AbiV family abortive infection protein
MAEDAPGGEPRPYQGDLNPLQAASAMQAARLTAVDLVDTAEILYNLKRFAHSAALSTLAIEETGKLPLLLMVFLGFGSKPDLWKSYRLHKAKTAGLNLGIESRVRVTFPDIPAADAREIGSLSPTPGDLEAAKQRAMYSDCLLVGNEFACHLPRNLDWRADAWARLCEAQALVSALRDYRPEELEIWLRHARAVREQGLGYKDMLEPLHADLRERGFLKEGQWAVLLESLRSYERGSDEGA